eukprot:jgi/Mesvir1/7162/Mv02522-RA.1
MAEPPSPVSSPVHVNVLINPEDKQLKTVAHSLLESKLEKILSSADTRSDPRHTKKLAIDWIKQWDLDGDGIISELEMKGAAMQHAKLQMGYKRRGIWLSALVVLAICLFFVILGLSVWANDVTRESKGSSGQSDLGGFIMRKTDSPAVVKTGTALYEFQLDRVGYLPFDQLSQITGIGFVHERALQFMDIEGFQWFGSNNVSFFSPRGTVLSVVKPTEGSLRLSLQEPGDAAPRILYQSRDDWYGYEQSLGAGFTFIKSMGLPVTVDNVVRYWSLPFLLERFANSVPVECVEPGLEAFNGTKDALSETCGIAILMGLQGQGVVEAAVGPQDYYGTELTKEEEAELTGWSPFTKGAIFDPDPMDFRSKILKSIQSGIDAWCAVPANGCPN